MANRILSINAHSEEIIMQLLISNSVQEKEEYAMRKLAIRLLSALITFAIGIFATLNWVIPYFRSNSQSSNLGSLQSSNQTRLLNCPNSERPYGRNFESAINTKGKSSWRWSETQISGKENLGVIQFVNSNEGWVGGDKGALYKTTDAGKTWQKVKIDVSSDSHISSISFVNPSVGWIVSSEEGNEFDDINTLKSWIFNTTDGGNTWQKQYFDKAIQIYNVQFINEQEGWAAGSRLPIKIQYVGLILHTTDGGKHWIDVSKSANRQETGNSGAIYSVYAKESSNALILKWNGIFYSTNDGGQSWQQVGSLPKGEPQEFLGHYTIESGNRMWAVGGPDSIEGMWGRLARMDADCSWTTYTVGGIRFIDAAILSDKNVIVGAVIPSLGPGKVFESRGRDAVILDSSDRGRSWMIVYRSSHTQPNALTKVDSNSIWVAGNNGYILHLQPKS